MLRYSICGLAIRSAIELDADPDGEGWDRPVGLSIFGTSGQTKPRVLPEPARDAVEVVLGDVPETLPEGRRYNALSEVAPGRLLLKMPRVARYLIEDGKRITVAPESGADNRALAVFSSGSPLAAILHQRGRVCLSASGVLTPKGAVLFCGPSGAGKSTLAAALSQRGFSAICDDFAAPIQAGAGWEAPRGPSFLKLWPDSLRMLGLDKSRLNPVRPGLRRRMWPIEGIRQQSVPLAAVFSLREARELRAERLPREDAIATLARDTHLPRTRAAVGSEWEYILKVAGIVSRTPCFSIVRDERNFEIADLANLVESLFASL